MQKEINILIDKIRESLSFDKPFSFPEQSVFEYDSSVSQIYITIFQEGKKSIRWGTKQATFEESIKRVIFKLKTNPNFINFNFQNSSKCRILFEIVTKEYPCNIRNLTTMRMNSSNRFEPGVNGLKWCYKGITRYFMPTDAYTKSIMSVNQLLNHLSKQCDIAEKTEKISERVHLMRREDITYSFVESKAFVSYNDEVLELQRGYPLPVDFSKDIVYDKTVKSIDWLVKNMNPNGSFLYFYDPYKNSIVDDMHPNMINPLYNNILRHSGGTISLLRGYELTKNGLYLEKAKTSIEFFISTFKEHKYKKKYACYPFFNQKSKLGGAGIGLVSLMHYYLHTKTDEYKKQMQGLVRHILSRIDSDGEMLGYYIHPKFYGGKPIINPDDETKKELFSFYYPGEALLGLALYYRYIEDIDEDLKEDIRVKSEKALDFLVEIRPKKYDYLFEPLPADAWLMQAIEEWVKVEELKKQSYIDFVFNDTKQMFEHMYKDSNTLASNKDYIGGFFYEYGEHVYHDASRCEGVVSAYYLAKYLKDEQKASWIMEHMILSAKGLMKTFHDEKSNYCHINPNKALHSFRFKLTRQWVRVDSVQHAACFFARFLPVYEKAVSEEHKYKIEEKIDKSGYSTVYLAHDKSNKKYAIKKIEQSRYIRLIENERKILEVVNSHNNLKFYELTKIDGYYCFIFDYAKNEDMKKFIERGGKLNGKEIDEFLVQMIKSLEFMKKSKLLHLDIKPANIVYYKNRYNLLDWGNSCFNSSARTVHLKGNPIYIAPEFYFGERDIASEIYSLGCSLYFLMTKKHIHNLKYSDSLAKKVYSILFYNVDMRDIKSNKYKYILSRMLDKNPKTRITLNKLKDELSREEKEFDSFFYEFKEPEKIDFSNELKIYELIEKGNIAYIQNEIGKIYIQENRFDEAYKMFEKGAENGYCNAQLNLALMHYVKKYNMVDLKKAFDLLTIASKVEYDKAQYYLGVFYEYGYACKKDIDKAIYWYKKSARNAYPKAYKKLSQKGIELKVNI